MPPIRLSNSELDAVMAAARPLPVYLRDPFLHAVGMRSPIATSSARAPCIRSVASCTGNFSTRRI